MNFFIGGTQRNCDIISHDLIKLHLIIVDIKTRNNIKKMSLFYVRQMHLRLLTPHKISAETKYFH